MLCSLDECNKLSGLPLTMKVGEEYLPFCCVDHIAAWLLERALSDDWQDPSYRDRLRPGVNGMIELLTQQSNDH